MRHYAGFWQIQSQMILYKIIVIFTGSVIIIVHVQLLNTLIIIVEMHGRIKNILLLVLKQIAIFAI